MLKHKNKGIITVWVLIFGTVFIIMFTGILTYLIFQIGIDQKTMAMNQAFHIAEAGLNYAKWHLFHSEEDYDFSGTYDYKDPEGAIIGHYQLEITAPSPCNPGVKIRSIGWQNGFENQTRTLKAKFAKTAMAKYGFLTNTNAWFGESETLRGPLHSNGGIRMDGDQNSISTSGKDVYTCGVEHGCTHSTCDDPCFWQSGVGCRCPGIWGDGEGQGKGLWQFPTANVNFDNLTRNLNTLRAQAQDSGVYLAGSSGYGYHVVFKSNGSFDVYTVSRLQSRVWGYDGVYWINESNSIRRESFLANFDIPSTCSPIFLEDNVWVDGVVNGRATLIAARLPDIPATNAKIFIAHNLTYLNQDSVLGLIAQKDILIPLYSDNDLTIQAAMMAQKGHIFRYYYPPWWWYPYNTYAKRNSLSTYGSIISNTQWTFSWVKQQGWQTIFQSGYEITDMAYDTDLTYNPPPSFPVSGDFHLVEWEEEQ